MKQYLKFIFFLIFFSIFVLRCSEKPEVEEVVYSVPVVVTLELSSMTPLSFECGGDVKDDGGQPVTARGICWSKNNNPTIADNKTSEGVGLGTFTNWISGLEAGETYYCRAYATNSVGTGYGSITKVALLEKEILYNVPQAYPGLKKELVEVNLEGITITCEKVNEMLFFQNDILIEPSFLKSTALNVDDQSNNIINRRRWIENTVYFTVDDSYPIEKRIDIVRAFDLFKETNIKFVERTNETDYVEIKYEIGGGCFSNLGRAGGKQVIQIDSWGTPGNIAHEIGHTLGLLHEQSKHNRDDFVIVNFSNIQENKRHNFYKYPFSEIYSNGYDFESLMGYPSKTGFEIDESKYSIVKLDRTPFGAQRQRFTDTDLSLINFLYPDLVVDAMHINLVVDQTEVANIVSGSGDYSLSSDNNSVAVATLSSNSISVSAISAGTTVINIVDNKTKLKVYFTVTVFAPMSFSTYNLQLEENSIGNFQILSGSGSFSVNSSNDGVAKAKIVSNNICEVEAIKSGTTYITVTDAKTLQEASVLVTVQTKQHRKISDIIPVSYLNELKRLGIPIYEGTTPPVVNGAYYISPLICAATNIPNDQYGPGSIFSDAIIRFSNQNNNTYDIDIETKHDGTSYSNSIETAITGFGRYFTVYGKTKSFKVADPNKFAYFATIYSGKLNEDGSIADYVIGTICIYNQYAQDTYILEGQGRVAFDGDYYSPRTIWNMTRSTKSSNIPLPTCQTTGSRF